MNQQYRQYYAFLFFFLVPWLTNFISSGCYFDLPLHNEVIHICGPWIYLVGSQSLVQASDSLVYMLTQHCSFWLIWVRGLLVDWQVLDLHVGTPWQYEVLAQLSNSCVSSSSQAFQSPSLFTFSWQLFACQASILTRTCSTCCYWICFEQVLALHWYNDNHMFVHQR